MISALYENCGGPQRLTVFQAGAPGTPAPSSTSAPAAPTSASVVATSSVLAPTPPVAPVSSSSAPATVGTSTPVSPPAGTNSGNWTAAGCVSDAAARALTGYMFSSPDMTVDKCTSACSSKGFSMAGIEYGDECYCKSDRAVGSVC